jgi:hypothetical protein
MRFRPSCLRTIAAVIMDRGPQKEGQRRSQVVVTKEVTMNDTLRAFLYGSLILTAALIPPILSVIDLIEKLVGS